MFPIEAGLERYELLRELSSNHAGATYKVISRDSQKTVAIRAVYPHAETDLQMEVLLQSANRALALQSPNVVLVTEVLARERAIYLVMDYAEGVTLSSALGTLSDWELIDVTRQVCSAIDHAGSRNVAHLKLHPANVIQEWDGTVKILDYGVVTNVVQRAENNRGAISALYYLSPEQARGEHPDRSSNLFSWGAMLYEMVVGQKPFAGDNPATVLAKIKELTPQAPHLVKPGVAPGLSSVIMKALAKSPSERFRTGADLVHALEHCKDEAHPRHIPAPVREVSENVQSSVAQQPPSDFHQPPSAAPSTPPTALQTPGPKLSTFVTATAVTTKIAESTSADLNKADGRLSSNAPLSSSEFLVVDSSASRAPILAATALRPNPKSTLASIKLKKAFSFQGLSLRSTPVLVCAAALTCLLAFAFLAGYFLRPHHSGTETQTLTVGPDQANQPAVDASQIAIAGSGDVVQPASPSVDYSLPRRRKQKPATPVAAPLPVPGAVSIQSSPEGASIDLDGQTMQFVTPHTATGLAAGSHNIRVFKSGFETQSRVIHIEAGQTLPLAVSLNELRATVAINSEPSGADILINGKETGRTTPATVMVLKGRYTVALHKQGFLQFADTLDASPGQGYSVSPRLARIGDVEGVRDISRIGKIFGRGDPNGTMGKVLFKTSPKGAQIAVNGKVLKKITPTKFLFPPGNYEVVMTLPGYKQVHKTITVVESSTINIEVPMER